MRKLALTVVVTAALVLPVVPAVAASASTPRTAVPHPSGAGSIRCSSVRGSIAFGGGIGKTSKAITVTTTLGSSQCAPSDSHSDTLSFATTTKQVVTGLTCTTIKKFTGAMKLNPAWSPAPSSHTAVTFAGFTTGTGTSGGTTLDFPATPGTASAKGPYAGSASGRWSSLDLETSTTPTALQAACQAGTLTKLLVIGGQLAIGDAAATITASPTATLAEGVPGSIPVTTSMGVGGRVVVEGNLPAGLELLASPGGAHAAIDGTPLVGTAGTYKVTLLAIDQDGVSASHQVAITVDPLAAGVPVLGSMTNTDGVSGASGTPGDSVVVSGKGVAGATAVSIGGMSASFSANSTGSVTAVIPLLDQGDYQVEVTTAGGTSPDGVASHLIVRSVPRRPQPAVILAEGLAMHVTWQGAVLDDDVTSYTLTVAPPAGYAGATVTSCDGPFVDGPLSATARYADIAVNANCVGVPYSVTMTAHNTSGDSAPSAPSSTAVAEDQTPPSVPVITDVGAHHGSLQVLWLAPLWSGGSAVTGYNLTIRAGSTSVHVSPAAGATSATVGGLHDGTAYSVSLTAHNTVGVSSTAVSTGTPTASPLPGMPTGLLVKPTGNGSSISVSWAPPQFVTTPLTGYTVTAQPVLGPGAACRSVATSGVGAGWKTSATLHTVLPACASGFTTISTGSTSYPAVRGKVKGTVVLSPAGGSATAAIPTSSVLTYDSAVVAGTARTLTTGGGTTSLTLPGLAPGSFYAVSVVARDAFGKSPPQASLTPTSPTVKLASHSVVLTSADMSALKDVVRTNGTDRTAYVWSSPAPSDVAAVTPGHAVVLPASAGQSATVLRVQSVWTDPAGDLVLSGSPGDLGDAYDAFSFSYTGTPALTGTGHAVHHARPHFVVNSSWNGGSVVGTFVISAYAHVGMSLWCTHTFLGLCYAWGLSASASAGASASVTNLVAHVSGSHSFDIYTCDHENGCMPAIQFNIGPIPVDIEPSVTVSLELSGDASISTSSASTSWSGWITFATNQSPHWTSGGGHNFSVNPIGSQASGTVHIGLNETGQVCAYTNVLCGSLTEAATLDAAFNTAATAPANSIALTCGLSGSMGFSLNLFGWNPSGSASIFTWSTLCYHVTGPPPTPVLNINNVSVGGYPLNVVPVGANLATAVATRSDALTPTITWSLVNRAIGHLCGDNITAAGVLTTGCVGGGRVLTIRAVDTSHPLTLIAYRQVTVVSVAPFNPVSIPGVSLTGPNFSPIKTATLFITPPPYTGGAAMHLYYVVFGCPILNGPSAKFITATGGLTVVTILTMGNQYCPVTIYPINVNATWGPGATYFLLL